MGELLLEESEMAFWQALVREGRQAANITLSDDIESYLVFLLMRFVDEAQLSTHIMALDYMKASLEPRVKRQSLLREVGDKCLIFSGLFPGIAYKRRVKVNYFIQIGQSAYRMLGNLHQAQRGDLYMGLSEQFVQLMGVLQAARSVNALEPLQAIELWEDTQSDIALQQFDGILFTQTSNKKKLH